MEKKFVDEEFKEQAKEAVDKTESFLTSHKKELGLGVIGIGLAAVFGGILKKTKVSVNKASFDMGKMAGRAELAEELAKEAMINASKNN